VWDQATARPSPRWLLWVHTSARLHNMGEFEATTCPEKVIYSKASTVVRIPARERRTSGYAVQTPKGGPGPPRVQAGPLEWDLDPSVWGLGRPQWGFQGPRTEHARALNWTQAGVRCRHVSRLSLVWTCPHMPLLPAQAETRCCHVAYCA
jgi:hypothetical protein